MAPGDKGRRLRCGYPGMLWPGRGFAPAKPKPGAHAEVTMTGRGRMGGGRMMPGLKQNQAFVVITWPGVPRPAR